jgi:hypothetical protein
LEGSGRGSVKALRSVVYFKTLPVSEVIYRRMIGILMNDKMESIWKETVVSQSRYYPDICLEGLMKPQITSVRYVR